MASSNFIAQSGLMKSGEAYTYSFRCVNVCFCAVGETLVSIETFMQNKVIELLFVTQASKIVRSRNLWRELSSCYVCLCVYLMSTQSP